MDELLKELDKYYNINSDPRYRGEHPKCDEMGLDYDWVTEYWQF